MTGDFKEFKIDENHANATSDERDAMGDTAVRSSFTLGKQYSYQFYKLDNFTRCINKLYIPRMYNPSVHPVRIIS